MVDTYELFYWPTIQGRGEFVRLAFEEAGTHYVDVARTPGGMPRMMKMLRASESRVAPFAPPFIKHGDSVIAQTANILAYVAPRIGLVQKDEATRVAAHQIQLTIADLIAEAHDAHHPIAVSLYYEDQRAAAKKRAAAFIAERIPKYLAWLEDTIARSGGAYLLGRQLSYVDLSAFQVVCGLSYAFPNAMARRGQHVANLLRLRDLVAARPRIALYLASERRIPFNEQGIFRHYPELDLKPLASSKARGRPRTTPRQRSTTQRETPRARRGR